PRDRLHGDDADRGESVLCSRAGAVHVPDGDAMAADPEHRELRPHHGHADVQGTDVPMFMNSYRGASAVSRLQRFFVESEGQGGQAMLEFALVLPVVLLIITGVFDVARAVWQENTLAYAARAVALVLHARQRVPDHAQGRLDAGDPAMKEVLPMRRTSWNKDEGGQAVVLIAITFLALIMAVGLAIDAGQLYVARRTMQEAADAAAYAGAVVRYQGGSVVQARSAAMDDATRNGYTCQLISCGALSDTPNGFSVVVEAPP